MSQKIGIVSLYLLMVKFILEFYFKLSINLYDEK